MDKELLNNISKLLDEKLAPIYKEIEEIKLDMSELTSQISKEYQGNKTKEFLQDKINKDLEYIKGYYYNRTQ